ncbi:MAG: hypothetical protein AAB427_12225 [Chloroflexota bacterium]
MKRHGWLGLGLMIAAEILLYTGVRVVATFFTPIMWTGYILFADGIVAARGGRSWLTARRREFGFLAVLSVFSWLLFEIYNFKLVNWVYVGMPEEMWLRDIGFFWSFATITPAIFETADLLAALWPRRFSSTDATDGTDISFFVSPSVESVPSVDGKLTAVILLGLALIAIPPALPDSFAPYTFGFVWIGFIFLLEPINFRIGAPSLWREWLNGNNSAVGLWLAAGMITGFLWEAWNYQTLRLGGAGWLYTMPDLIHNLIFGLHYGKMPLAGLLGFPPFAMECFAIYYFLRQVLRLDQWSY